MSTSSAFDVCLLTPPGRGAVATLGIAGPAALAAVMRFFQAASGSSAAPVVGRIYYGRWDSERGEEIVVCRRAAEEIEIHCHGGIAAVQAIVDDLTAAGGQSMDWRAWIARRASDPLEHAALVALASARTERTADILLAQREGALRRALLAVVTQLQQGEQAAAAEALRVLRSRAAVGLHLTIPFQVVLAGRPNVGKSSLVNALLGYERTIVYAQPGTTRDVVASETAIDGWAIALSDTAGLRATDDPVEDEGVRRARARAQSCDLLALVFDAAAPWGADDDRLRAEFPAALAVFNKSDLVERFVVPAERAGVVTSATTGAGVDQLIAAMVCLLVPDPPPTGAGVPFTAAQVASIDAALSAVVRNDLTLAQQALAEMLS